jgi:hypothetical protein
MADLPGEVVELIVGCLANDLRTLKSCRLASRILEPSAEAYLFRRVVLCADHKVEPPPGTRLRQIIDRFAVHIRELKIDGAGTIDGRPWLDVDSELLPALEAFISGFGVSQLQVVSLWQIVWNSASSDLKNTLQRLLACQSLAHIELASSDIPASVFNSFPAALKVLELRFLTFTSLTLPEIYPEPVIHLESLIVQDLLNVRRVADALFNSPRFDVARLRSLSLYTHGLATYRAWIYQLSPSVEILTLATRKAACIRSHTKSDHVQITGSIEQQRPPLDLHQFPRLKQFVVLFAMPSSLVIVGWLADSLKYLGAGNHLRSLTILYGCDELLDGLAWAELDSVLAGQRFEAGKFDGIDIEVPMDDFPFDEAVEFFSFRLPKTNEKKLLKVVGVSSFTSYQWSHIS